MIHSAQQFNTIFGNTSLPVLEQVASFNEARQNLIAGNIANYDTPGYQARDMDVSQFKNDLASAVRQKHESGNSDEIRYPLRGNPNGSLLPADIPILYHDFNNVGMEFQVTEMTKNHMEFNTALNIMKHQMNLLQTSISERV